MRARNVNLTDYQTLTNLDWSPLTRPPTSLFAYFVGDQSHVCFVAEDENQTIGALVGYRSSCGRRVHIAAMKSLRQGEGIGRLLIEALKATCHHMGVERVWCFTTDKVQGFYEKMGFTVGELGIFKEAMVDGLMVMEWTDGHTE